MPVNEVAVKPFSLYLNTYISLLRSGQEKKADALISYAAAEVDVLLGWRVLKMLTLAKNLYKKAQLTKEVDFTSADKAGWACLRDKVLANARLKVLFINDNGFNAGAGVGLHRQVQSFLSAGHTVQVIAFHPKPEAARFDLSEYPGDYLGSVNVSKLLAKGGGSSYTAVLGYVVDYSPDLIISGNFHAKSLPVTILTDMQSMGYPVVAYAHDCDWVTGGCAHFLYHQCDQWKTGCSSESCPKSEDSYPPTKRSDITNNWLEREAAFSGENPIPIAVNSQWVESVFSERFGKSSLIKNVPLGLNTDVYAPKNKFESKQFVGVDPNKFLVLAGSSSLGTRGKGGEYIKELIESLAHENDIVFGLIGRSDGFLLNSKNVKFFGYVSKDEDMAKIYSAADVFFNPVTVEAFGQTTLEAASSGCVPITFNACGVGEVSVEGVNALHCVTASVREAKEKILSLFYGSSLMEKMSEAGRILSEQRFSLSAQMYRWLIAIEEFSGSKLPFCNERLKARSGISGREMDKALPPKVAVVTVTYNVGSEFDITARSIVEQVGVDFEWIVIDGGSNEESLNVIKPYRKFISRLVVESDDGIYDAMNKSLEYVSAEYVIFMGSGDFFASRNVLYDVSGHLNGESDVVYGNVYEVRTNGDIIKTDVHSFSDKWKQVKRKSFGDIPIMKGLPPHQATFVKKDVIKKHKFDLKYKVSADWDLIFRLYNSGYKFKSVPNVIAWYPNGGFSAQNSAQWLKDVRSILSRYVDDVSGLNLYYDKLERNQLVNLTKRQRTSEVVHAYDEWLANGYVN